MTKSALPSPFWCTQKAGMTLELIGKCSVAELEGLIQFERLKRTYLLERKYALLQQVETVRELVREKKRLVQQRLQELQEKLKTTSNTANHLQKLEQRQRALDSFCRQHHERMQRGMMLLCGVSEDDLLN